MKRAKAVFPIVLCVLLVSGMLTVSGHAKKPVEPVLDHIVLTGDISGTGDPAAMRVNFSETFISSEGSEAGWHAANPDGRLRVRGPRRHKRLGYYYCSQLANVHGALDCCDPVAYPSHDPDDYKYLQISGGFVEGKGRDTHKVFFPAGSTWTITQKVVDPDTQEVSGLTIGSGTLVNDVVYEEFYQ